MKKYLLIFFWILFSCQDGKKDLDNTMDNKSFLNNEERLIDRITIDNTIFKKDDIDLKKYQYEGHYIGDLKIKDLMSKNYREEFIKYLKEVKVEDDEFKSTLISQLLFLRMIQLSDTNAFYILSELSKDDLIAYNGIELYPEKLVKFFIENPFFFIQQGAKYHETKLLSFIKLNLDEFLVQKNFFKDNFGEINLKNGQLFLFPAKEMEFNQLFRDKISRLNTEECIFSPCLYTAWQNKTINFIDISSIFGEELLNQLNVFEKNYFMQNVKPVLKKYIIENNSTPNYKIQDPDGYTNLRKDKNASSEILQQIKSGESIDVLENQGDWWLVKTSEGKQGYVHKSRVKVN